MVIKKSPVIFSPEIKKFQNTQMLEFRGKDARGYDFSVHLCSLKEPLLRREPPHSSTSDQVEAFFGSDPDNLEDIGTEITLTLGKERETHRINSAGIVYIPRGLEHSDIEFETPSRPFWHLNITLPPKYAPPQKKAKGT